MKMAGFFRCDGCDQSVPLTDFVTYTLGEPESEAYFCDSCFELFKAAWTNLTGELFPEATDA